MRGIPGLIWEILLNEVNRGDLEAFPIQICEDSGVCCEVKPELVGVKRLIFPVIALVELAVFSVAEQRPSGGCHLRADLVRAARQELTLHERKPAFCFQRPVECDGGLCAGLRLFGDVDAVFLCILET